MKKILVVEDEKLIVNVLSQKFKKEGFSVFSAIDGLEGYKVALEKHPDLILLDIIMPRMDGLKMLSKLRTDPWGKTVPVVVLTNVDTASHFHDQILKENPVYYFIKANIP